MLGTTFGHLCLYSHPLTAARHRWSEWENARDTIGRTYRANGALLPRAVANRLVIALGWFYNQLLLPLQPLSPEKMMPREPTPPTQQ